MNRDADTEHKSKETLTLMSDLIRQASFTPEMIDRMRAITPTVTISGGVPEAIANAGKVSFSPETTKAIRRIHEQFENIK